MNSVHCNLCGLLDAKLVQIVHDNIQFRRYLWRCQVQPMRPGVFNPEVTS